MSNTLDQDAIKRIEKRITIQQIISKLNYLNANIKNMPASQWLYEINKYESLFCNHAEADNTCYRDNKLVMKSSY